VASKIKTAGVEKVHATTYFRKAVQFCEAAADAYAQERYDAAMALSIHAGISASDAACVGLGTRKCTDSHERAADLLEEVGSHSHEFVDAAKQLRLLVAQKNAIEYENKRATRRDAEFGVRRCGNLVGWTRNTLEKAKLL
jgi:hypothetical protein